METPQLPNPPESASQPEAFFPEKHPRVTWALGLAALAVCWAALFCPSALGMHGDGAEVVLVLINSVVYVILARVLYGFSLLRSFAVMGLMLLTALVCAFVIALLVVLHRAPFAVL